MKFNLVEIIGLIGSLLICFSMVWRTTSFKGTILMRVINGSGSIFFVVYGFILPAYATAIANIVCFIVNVIWLIKEIKLHKKEDKH